MKADYIDHMGDDLRVVNAARVSFDKESDWATDENSPDGHGLPTGILKEEDARLISYLARNGHWTPFSHPMITMRETIPIFVARQRFKHMVGFTYNEVSRRYVDDTPEFFSPDVWRARPDASIKQGSGDRTIKEFVNPYGEPEHHPVEHWFDRWMEDAEFNYNKLLEWDVAPEQARMVLPQSMYTSYYVTGSLAAWARAYKQRIDSHAQKEIQDLAKQWDAIIQTLFPVSWAALTGQRPVGTGTI
ncbi:FAD-dependent thymidylate synthase [Kineobactrum salinum]|uniref:FAD-dependent thymidylate synthase n=1 Tax=Kineobactrum salinum TaxID=2708301 RepID=A0A6C0U4V6_9GAMM|nr:FAD-dependent thymidylate synthase [Kineobactrum salinum]QIB67141.1 FAD-dependent thymidylate synthase [Kineobactrum salinum]